MTVQLGPNAYGKAAVRLVRVDRAGERHAVTDLTVSSELSGDLDATHLTGDNRAVLPTDSQKNTVYAFARDGVGEPEEFATRLARHFVTSQPAVHRARVTVESHRWDRAEVDGASASHSFVRSGGETRLCTVTVSSGGTWVVSGLRDLVLMNTTGSEFTGFPRDAYTTLAETRDRILATAVEAWWRHASTTDWLESYAECRRHLVEAFAGTYSLSLQQTLYAMGRRVLERRPEVAEVRLTLPNRHHLPVDLAPFGLDNPNEVLVATSEPYGLITGTVLREGASPGRGVVWGGVRGGRAGGAAATARAQGK